MNQETQGTPLVREESRIDDLDARAGRIDYRQIFTCLRYRNYRLWFYGQMVSLFGTWMQITAQGFLIFELTKSPAFLGYLGFANGVPSWLFMLWGGVIADRIPRRTLLMITQTIMMILAFILASLTFSGLVEPWHVLVLATLGGIANAFDAPARMSFISEMVPKEDMTNAIALNSTMFNVATAIGPGISGVTYFLFGPAWCFTINGLSFIAVIVALYMMNITLPPIVKSGNSALKEIREGFVYIKQHRSIAAIIFIVSVTTLFGISCFTLIPAWSVDVLGGDSTTNGLLLSARGVGALLSALIIASLGRFQFKGKVLTFGTMVFPLMVLIFALITWLPFSLIILFCVGLAQIAIFNMANALIQTQVEDRIRGRVMGLYSLTFFGLMPIGALWFGWLAEGFGSKFAILSSASIMFLVMLSLYIFVPKLRQLK